jgi:hypothetical protein
VGAAELGCWVGGRRVGRWFRNLRVWFLKRIQTKEFKLEFEFQQPKQCSNMYATFNSYISLILF